MRHKQSPSSPSLSATSSDKTQSPVDTVGILMVPTQDIQTYTTDLESRGFNIDITIVSLRILEEARVEQVMNKH